MLFSEAFAKMGVPGVHRGSPWAAINRDGVLCIMGHSDYFKRGQSGLFYEHPAQPGLSAVPAAMRALAVIKPYFAPGKPAIIAVGEFASNGGPDGTGKIVAAQFKKATGDAFEATLSAFEFDSGFFHANCKAKFRL
jgi:hypothetical protein